MGWVGGGKGTARADLWAAVACIIHRRSIQRKAYKPDDVRNQAASSSAYQMIAIGKAASSIGIALKFEEGNKWLSLIYMHQG
jgi:hypothetical protein